MGSSEDPNLVNNVDELGMVYQGLNLTLDYTLTLDLTESRTRRPETIW